MPTTTNKDLLDTIIWEKRKTALALWAVNKISQDQKELSEDMFMGGVLLLRKMTGCDYLTAIKETPYIIPDKPGKKNAFGPKVNLFRVLNEYERTLILVKKIQKKTRRNATARKIAFKENFPGVPEARLGKYLFISASEIAMDYLAWKYKSNVSGDAIKKYLGEIRSQRRSIKRLDEALRKRSAQKQYIDISSAKEKWNWAIAKTFK